jgi:hypothetical protein
MNGLMIVAGLAFAGIGLYSFTSPRADTEFGLRLRGVDTEKVDVADHSNAVRRTKGAGAVTLLLGMTMGAWGVFGWSGDALSMVLLFGGSLLYGAVFLLTW